MKKVLSPGAVLSCLRRNLWSILILFLAALLFLGLRLYLSVPELVLPELIEASYEKSVGYTLCPKSTALGALRSEDLCTYVQIDKLTVCSVEEYEVHVRDDSGRVLPIYRPVVDQPLSVDDMIRFTGTVSAYKGKLQLRNTLPSEIEVCTPSSSPAEAPSAAGWEEEQPAFTPIADAVAASEGAFTVRGVVTLIDGKRLFLQDGSGGICLRLSAAPTDVFLGDTLIGKGIRLGSRTGDYVEYERGVVTKIRSDSCFADPVSEGAQRGVQDLIVEAETGQYAGTAFTAKNYVYPMYGGAVEEGDSVSLIVSTYDSGEVYVEVFQFNRITPLLIVIGLFFAVTLLVGRGTGAKSLVALVVTVLCLFYILFPLLMRGAPTLLTVFLVCAYIAVVSFTILGGIRRKSLCAMLGTIAGVAIALLFGLLAQTLCRVNGLNTGSEPIGYLTQLRNDGSLVGMKGLLAAGVTVSALGAVMDVAMSISSALEEVHAANPALGIRALFRSGMNIGKDMVGTMTNTLILAFLGSSFTMILYLYALGLSPYQLLPSAYLSVEVVSGVSSSVGMILAIPLTAAVSALWLDRRKKG